MMITITPLEDGYLIENSFLFGNEIVDERYISLKAHANTDDILAKMRQNIIDFPWEYDIAGNYIRAIVGKNNEMNYFVKTKHKKSFAIIQSPKVLDHDELINVQHWVFTDEKVAKKIEQLELDGEKINITWEAIQSV